MTTKKVLSDEFIEKYRNIVPRNGDLLMIEILLNRTFADTKEDGTKEKWVEVITRVVNGIFEIILDFTREKISENVWLPVAEKMFDAFFHLEALPSGRSLFHMGRKPIMENKLYEAFNSCSFFSTKDMDKSPLKALELIFYFHMLGVGVGSDLRGAGKCKVKHPMLDLHTRKRIIKYTSPFPSDMEINGREFLESSEAGFKFLDDMETDDINMQMYFLYDVEDVLLSFRKDVSSREKTHVPWDKSVYNTYWLIMIEIISHFLLTPEYQEVEMLPEYKKMMEEWNSVWSNDLYRNMILEDDENGFITFLNVDKSTKIRIKVSPCSEHIKWYRIQNMVFENKYGKSMITDFFLLYMMKKMFQDFQRDKKPDDTEEVYQIMNEFYTRCNELMKSIIEIRHQVIDQAYLEETGDGYRDLPYRKRVLFHTTATIRNKTLVGYDGDSCNPIRPVEDSRNGWLKTVIHDVLAQFLKGESQPDVKEYLSDISYHLIRPKGTPMKTFRGIASGPDCLIKMIRRIRRACYCVPRGSPLPSIVLQNIINWMGCCVMEGNIQRGAQIIYSDMDDMNFINSKNYTESGRDDYGWISNNSVFYEKGKDITHLVDKLYLNGEPGFINLENCRKYNRINPGDVIPYAKKRKNIHCMGTNPCGEQPLEDKEMCNLGEIFLPYIRDKQHAKDLVAISYYYCKAISFLPSIYPEVDEVQKRNRRLGISISGVIEVYQKWGEKKLIEMLDFMYNEFQDFDKNYSAILGIPESIAITTVKPSGTLSLLASVTPACNLGFARKYYIRRITINRHDPLIGKLRKHNYELETSLFSQDHMIVSIPKKYETDIPRDVDWSMDEQYKLINLVQKFYSDNCVSNTIKFDPKKVSKIEVQEFLERILPGSKCISLMPIESYLQSPFEEITEERYQSMTKNIIPWDSHDLNDDEHLYEKTDPNDNAPSIPLLFCDSDKCIKNKEF